MESGIALRPVAVDGRHLGMRVVSKKHFRENVGRHILSLRGDPEAQGLLTGEQKHQLRAEVV